MKIALAAAALAAAIAVAGCGGSKPKYTANCNPTAGAASGDKLVGGYSAAKFQVASILDQSYTAWVNGKDTGGGGPGTALCPVEQQAAASIVLHYAADHQGQFSASSAAVDGGRDVDAYLKAHGVQCGSQCALRPTATDLQLQASSKSSTSEQESAQSSSDSQASSDCLSALGAGAQLTKLMTVASGQGAGDGGASELTPKLAAFAQSLAPLEVSASPSQQAQLKADQQALVELEGQGGAAVIIGFTAPPLKSVVPLLNQVCNS